MSRNLKPTAKHEYSYHKTNYKLSSNLGNSFRKKLIQLGELFCYRSITVTDFQNFLLENCCCMMR